MSQGRGSMLVRFGRAYQVISPLFSPIDAIIRSFAGESTESPCIFLIAPPRSGSTLTYQLMTSGIENNHLTNLWNLLYATPYLGGKLAIRNKDSSVVSGFRSRHGFVDGLNGEAEGLRFWKYWTGIGLTYKDRFDMVRAKRLNAVLKKLGDKPFVSGFLGHAQCVRQLRENFDNTLFVFLERDIRSNAYSLYKASPVNSFSVRTAGMEKATGRFEEIAIQLKELYSKMKDEIGPDSIRVSYEKICNDPKAFLSELIRFADIHGFSLKLKNEDRIPQSFRVGSSDLDSDTRAKIDEQLHRHGLITLQ